MHDQPTGTYRYGEHPSQFAELTIPRGQARGVAVVIHGGFWKPAYGLEFGQPLVPSLVSQGWAAWVIEYRRGSGAPHTLADVLAAIEACPVTCDSMVAIGHSAGGHLAAWAGNQRVGITHVVAQAAVLDLRAAHVDRLGDGAVERFLGHPPSDADDASDPARQIPLPVPIWCIHGRDDADVPVTQSRGYVAAAQAAGATAVLVEVDGGHFTVIDPGSEAWSETLQHLATL